MRARWEFLDEAARRRIANLAVEFPALWSDTGTPVKERKRMLAYLVEDVTLIKQERITAHVRFRGGATRTLVGRATSTSQQSSAEAYASLGDGALVASAGEYCVGIRVPELSGSSPGIGASIVTTPAGCYIAAGMDGPMDVALVDLDIELVTSGGPGKAQTASPTLTETYLGQASPNPFNPMTTVEFGVPTPTIVTLRVFDVTGRMVRQLLSDRIEAGIHRRVWDGRDSNGATVAAGVYMIHFAAGSTIFHQKIVLVK